MDINEIAAMIGIVKKLPDTAVAESLKNAQDAQTAAEAAETAAEQAKQHNYGIYISGNKLVIEEPQGGE